MQRPTRRRTFVLRWSIAFFSAVTALAAQGAHGFFVDAGERVRAVEEPNVLRVPSSATASARVTAISSRWL